MSEINYWRIPYTQLPSLGERYPHGSSIKFRCMTVNDLKYMASLKDENADEMVTDILERCLKLDGVRFDQLLRMDRLTMLFFVRTNTFLLSNGFQTEFDCPHCGSRERQEFKMSDLKVKKITESTIHDVDMVDELGICVSGEYKTFDLGYAVVEAVQAGNNRNHNIKECVGWVITLSGGVSVYVTGDTSTTDQMAELADRNIHYAFFVCDGRFNMDMEEASACAKLVNAQHSIPYHMAPGKLFDAERAELFDGPNRLIVPAGEEITLE